MKTSPPFSTFRRVALALGLWSLVFGPAFAAQAVKDLTLTGTTTDSSTYNASGARTFLAAATVTFNAGSTLTVNGTLAGTPSGGTLSLANLTLTLPSSFSGVVLGANGGTGVANTGKTITLGGNLVTSGAVDTTLTVTGTTNVTLPTTGTLATLAGAETLTNKTLTAPVISTISNTGTLTLPTATDTLVGRATTDTLTNKALSLGSNTLTATSAQLATAVSDETGSGALVFADSPTFTTPNIGAATGTSAKLAKNVQAGSVSYALTNYAIQLNAADVNTYHHSVGWSENGTNVTLALIASDDGTGGAQGLEIHTGTIAAPGLAARFDAAHNTQLAGKLTVSGTSGIKGVRTATTTWDPASLADGAVSAVAVTLTGVVNGDTCSASFTSAAGQDVLMSAHVSAADTVRVTLMNKTGGALDLASGTVRVTAISF